MTGKELKDYLETEGIDFVDEYNEQNTFLIFHVYEMKYKDTPIYIWCLFEDKIEFITTGDKTNGFTWEKDFGYAKADEYLNFVIHFKELKKLKEMGTDFE